MKCMNGKNNYVKTSEVAKRFLMIHYKISFGYKTSNCKQTFLSMPGIQRYVWKSGRRYTVSIIRRLRLLHDICSANITTLTRQSVSAQAP